MVTCFPGPVVNLPFQLARRHIRDCPLARLPAGRPSPVHDHRVGGAPPAGLHPAHCPHQAAHRPWPAARSRWGRPRSPGSARRPQVDGPVLAPGWLSRGLPGTGLVSGRIATGRQRTARLGSGRASSARIAASFSSATGVAASDRSEPRSRRRPPGGGGTRSVSF